MSYAWAVFCTVLRYVGIGLVQMPLVTWGNNSVPDEDMPQVTAMLTAFRNLGGALGVALFVGILDSAGPEFAFAAMGALSFSLFLLVKSANAR